MKNVALLLTIVITPVLSAQIIYVDTDTTGTNDGSTWQNAFNYLQDAIAVAVAGDEIRVAQGTYIPDSNSANPDGTGDRSATFQLLNGVTLKGGYAGFGHPEPNARDIGLYETVLSGDLHENDFIPTDSCDLMTEPTRAENSYHVVTSTGGLFSNPILDGFTITAGNADDDSWEHRAGGGMRCAASARIANCLFIHNTARAGGAMLCAPREWVTCPTLTNCRFHANAALKGGAMNIGDSNPIIANCTFSDNSAVLDGGAFMFYNDNSSELLNCEITGNTAGRNGGAMFCVFCFNWQMTGCTIAHNIAGGLAGGMDLDYDCYMTFNTCILWGNTDSGDDDKSAQITVNCTYPPAVKYCCIHGTPPAGDDFNIGANPLFADPNGPDNILGTEDDNFRLLPDSPCIDAGDPCYVPTPNETDLDGNPRIMNGRIDMGAYEYVQPAVIEADIRIVPRILNLQSKGRFVLCVIRLPEDYKVADIDRDSILLQNQIEPRSVFISRNYRLALAIFNRANLQDILKVGRVELSLTGWLNDQTPFEGADTVRVIKPRRCRR